MLGQMFNDMAQLKQQDHGEMGFSVFLMEQQETPPLPLSPLTLLPFNTSSQSHLVFKMNGFPQSRQDTL